ncbi:hypothetical protein GX586_15350 [bacterium]|nr:hypothetical protein [bacterium]
MITACDIIEHFEKLKGWPIGREEGVQHGRWDRPVRNVTVCWKATLAVFAEAGGRGDDLIIGHESLYDPYDFDFNAFVQRGWQEWALNKRRREALDKHNLSYLRLHSTVDQLFIGRGFADMLGLDQPVKADNGAHVWERDECELRELVEYVKKCTGLPLLRVCAPKGLGQRVHRIGLLLGGGGLDSNVGAQQRLADAGCDVLISGESDNYGFRYAQDCGIPTIETSHELCENPGIRLFMKALGEQFKELRITFYENKCPYEIV